jgi:hypothetical protein
LRKHENEGKFTGSFTFSMSRSQLNFFDKPAAFGIAHLRWPIRRRRIFDAKRGNTYWSRIENGLRVRRNKGFWDFVPF